jgi:RsiW-degrading membrane proteinase PrsW (M82 family)
MIAFLGGIIPALVWLWFWLSEDKRCPEPKSLLLLTFFAGMASVILVIPLERFSGMFVAGTTLIFVWAVIEEVMKYLVAFLVILRNKAVNEPIDAVIYMITAALGFAALENMLFLLTPISDGLLLDSILTGNLRFIGATLVHTLASAIVGASIAFTFYYTSKSVQYIWLWGGLILASTLHALFNFFILKSNDSTGLLLTFTGVWVGVIILILLFEKIKRIQKPEHFIT